MSLMWSRWSSRCCLVLRFVMPVWWHGSRRMVAGLGGGDVAGLALTEDAPGGAAPARFTAAVPAPGTWLRVFGYPGDPPRPGGAFVDVDLKGQVGGQMLQVESRSGQTVRAQPGFSGSPVWDPATGEAAGLLQAAPQAGEPQRDAYLLPPRGGRGRVGGAV